MLTDTFYDIIDNPTKTDGYSLEELVQEYPFCEIGWLLYLKNLSDNKSLRYENELKCGAIYVTNKERLFYLIKGDIFDEKEPVNPVPTGDYFKDIEDENEDSDDILNAFLRGEREKNRTKFVSEVDDVDEHSPEILTETLAKIYINQGQYDRAKNIYEKLILRNPDKSAYFASQIEKIKLLNS